MHVLRAVIVPQFQALCDVLADGAEAAAHGLPDPDMRRGTDLTGTWATKDGSASVLLVIDDHTAEILASTPPNELRDGKRWS